jgi:hypothetical protein
MLERWHEHLYDRGGMRRLHLRGREIILKRLVVHAGAANLGLLMRKMFGAGTPKRLQGGRVTGAFSALIDLRAAIGTLWPLLIAHPGAIIRRMTVPAPDVQLLAAAGQHALAPRAPKSRPFIVPHGVRSVNEKKS